MDDEIIRIVVFTDSHLGFQERDPVRSEDSFAAFEEALKHAHDIKADLVLHAGDMFHENRPSRRTLHSAMTILKKYCMGDAPVRIEVLNDQAEVFKMNGGVVNYENPNISICMPVFAIHGNHDDTSREGGGAANQALSALDLLAVSNFVNYYGKAEQVDDIVISPVLIRKKSTNIALYGLGAMRDERLNRMWHSKNVRFSQPPNANSWFNILVLHQNRDYGRGKKNCIHESMIPEWMDLVIWGNEHECIPRLQESLVGTYRIYQPGSSVATSYSEGESNLHPKNIGCVHIKQKKFKLVTELFSQVRPFVYSDIKLSDFPQQIQAASPKVEDQIKSVLKAKVQEMIQEARALHEGIAAAAVAKKLMYRVKEPNLVLIRLRCDHAGFTSINPSRFGALFVGQVANASDILAFSKKSLHHHRAVEGQEKKNNERRSAKEMMDQAIADGEEDAIHKIKIEDLVTETLTGKSKLQLIREEDMAQALEDFVAKKNISAISDAITAELEHCQEKLWKSDTLDNPTKESVVEAAGKVKGDPDEKVLANKRAAAAAKPAGMDGDDIYDDDDDEPVAPKKRAAAGAKKGAAAKTTKKSPAAKKPVSKATKGKAKGRGKVVASDDDEDDMDQDEGDDDDVDDDDMDHDEEKVVQKASKATKAAPAARKSSRAVERKSYAVDLENVEEIDDDEIDMAPPVSRRTAKASATYTKEKESVVDLLNDDDDGHSSIDFSASSRNSMPTIYSATSAVDDTGGRGIFGSAASASSQAGPKKRAFPSSVTAPASGAVKKKSNLNWD